MQDVRIDTLTIHDEREVLRLLSEAGLPIEDLTDDKLKDFLVARRGDSSVIGAIGVELYGDRGLLRSLVVHPSYRGRGLGKRLTSELEFRARKRGIKTLYLLTMSAVDFFPRLGYKLTRRATVPEPIARTEEFKSACPVSAACLYKDLESE